MNNHNPRVKWPCVESLFYVYHVLKNVLSDYRDNLLNDQHLEAVKRLTEKAGKNYLRFFTFIFSVYSNNFCVYLGFDINFPLSHFLYILWRFCFPCKQKYSVIYCLGGVNVQKI